MSETLSENFTEGNKSTFKMTRDQENYCEQNEFMIEKRKQYKVKIQKM